MKKYVNECEGYPFDWFYEQFKEVTIDDGIKQIETIPYDIQIILSKKGELIIYDQFFSKLLTTYTHPEQKIEQFTVILNDSYNFELGYRVENGDMYYLFVNIESTNGTDDIYQFESQKIENISNVSSIASYELRFETSPRYLCGLSENQVKCVDYNEDLNTIIKPFEKIPNGDEKLLELRKNSIITDKNIYFISEDGDNTIRYLSKDNIGSFIINSDEFCSLRVDNNQSYCSKISNYPELK